MRRWLERRSVPDGVRSLAPLSLPEASPLTERTFEDAPYKYIKQNRHVYDSHLLHIVHKIIKQNTKLKKKTLKLENFVQHALCKKQPAEAQQQLVSTQGNLEVYISLQDQYIAKHISAGESIK